jgi:hypothetical protein
VRYAYPAGLEPVAGASVRVTFQVLLGASSGNTEAEARAWPEDLLVPLSDFVSDGPPMPPPRPAVACRFGAAAVAAAKLMLQNALLAAKLPNVELGQWMGPDETEARRLRDPLHRSHIDELEAAPAH